MSFLRGMGMVPFWCQLPISLERSREIIFDGTNIFGIFLAKLRNHHLKDLCWSRIDDEVCMQGSIKLICKIFFLLSRYGTLQEISYT